MHTIKATDIQVGDVIKVTDYAEEWQMQGTVTRIHDGAVHVSDNSMRGGFEFTIVREAEFEIVLVNRDDEA